MSAGSGPGSGRAPGSGFGRAPGSGSGRAPGSSSGRAPGPELDSGRTAGSGSGRAPGPGSDPAAGAPHPRTGLLGLGSNVGDRRAQLQAAVQALPGIGVEVLAASSTYDTDPVGEVLEQPSFLNACLLVRTSLEPLELLDAVKELESRLGREAGGVRHGPRVIDIDILLLGELQLADERMTLPHEQLTSRRFVLIPALELDFELAVGGQDSALRLADALARLDTSEGVRWAGPPLDLPSA